MESSDYNNRGSNFSTLMQQAEEASNSILRAELSEEIKPDCGWVHDEMFDLKEEFDDIFHGCRN